ncbi:MAG: sulfurtransferase TusA family protein [Pleomorphochaeta sp.]|jgi:TusA-related sulfurtransferase
METKVIDARGQSCPIPIVLTKKAIDAKPEKLEVIVDNVAAKENVTRFATTMGYNVELKDIDNGETKLFLEKK